MAVLPSLSDIKKWFADNGEDSSLLSKLSAEDIKKVGMFFPHLLLDAIDYLKNHGPETNIKKGQGILSGVSPPRSDVVTITMLQDESFAHGYHWHILFPSYNKDAHKQFFPANLVSQNISTYMNSSVEYGPSEFSYPKKAISGGNLSVQLYEVSNWAVVKWLRTWTSYIFDDKDYTVGLIGDPDISKEMRVYNLGWDGLIHIADILYVIPDSEVTVELTSGKSDLVNISLSLIVVGRKYTPQTLVEGVTAAMNE